jgi:hypothetical protein
VRAGRGDAEQGVRVVIKYIEAQTPTHGYAATREAAMAAFAETWRRK